MRASILLAVLALPAFLLFLLFVWNGSDVFANPLVAVASITAAAQVVVAVIAALTPRA